jgi:ATP-dependent exoDNAse (exonuclease V) beta subunit
VHAALRRRLGATVESSLANLSKAFQASELGARWVSFIDHLESRSAEICEQLPTTPPGTGWESLPDWKQLADRLLTKAGKPRKTFGPAGGFYSGFSKTGWADMIRNLGEEVSLMLHEVRSLPGAEEEPTDVDALKDFILLSALCISAFHQACRKRHTMDFIGLEEAALRILREDFPTDLHLHLDYRIRHLLVDEFQDTSRNQWELVKRLCSGWEPGDGRTLFIVGDPKQSIYAFRKAEVRLFLEARDGLPLPGRGKLPLRPLRLTTNFRSRRGLIEWCNDIFGNTVMINPNADADEVPFSGSVPAPGTVGESAISLSLFTGEAEQSKTEEARWLAGKVRQVLAETDGMKSIAILLFTRNRLHRYLQAFKEECIPLQVKEGLLLAERPEILHLLQVARAVARPQDDLAWASLVRAPWNWFGKDFLLRISRQEGTGWRDKILSFATGCPEMTDLCRAIDHVLKRGGRDTLGRVVRDFWEMLDGPRYTSALYGMAGVTNCLRFFQVLEDGEQGVPQETLLRLESRLKTLYEPVDPMASRSPVTMMTVHGAKGLEFDIVFIPFLDWHPLSSGGQTPPAYLLERVPGTSGEYLVAMGTDRRTGEPTPLFRLLKKFQQDRRIGEAKRLFYVAATRAREALIMSGIAERENGTVKAKGGSLLGWVMSHEKRDSTDGVTGSSPSPGMVRIEIDPGVNKGLPSRPPTSTDLPEPFPLRAEKTPYVVVSPSALPVEAAVPAGEEGQRRSPEGSAMAARGTVTHRILNRVIRGGSEPSRASVEKALISESVPVESSANMAEDILKEVAGVLKDPIISRLLAKDTPVLKSEWAIEDSESEHRIRSGILDLVVFDGTSWWIIDFKTSRPPDENPETFAEGQRELYRPQLEAYRSILGKAKSVREENIRAGIYLTAIKKWCEI